MAYAQTPSQEPGRPAKANRMGTGAPSLAAPLHSRTDLPAFLQQVKAACCLPPGNADQGRAVEALKAFGSRYDECRVVTKTAMGSSSGTVGGYLLPTAISLKLLKSLAERSFIYPRALTVDMSTRTVQAPIFDLGAGASAQSPFVGGMTFQWEGTPPETDAVFAMVDLTAWTLFGYTRMSNQVLADMGPEAESLLIQLFAMAGAVQAEYGFMQGTGTPTSQPVGVINAPCALAVVRAAPNAIAQADVVAMAAKMIPLGWRNAIWAVNPSALKQLFAISNFTPNRSDHRDDGACGYLFTRPVFPTEKAPALGSTGDLTFFDPSLYVIGTRTEVLVTASEHSRFQNYQTEFMVALRIDGMPLMNNSVTLADGSTKASMVVVLQ
jgi:HK97 family phage major capsid protein